LKEALTTGAYLSSIFKYKISFKQQSNKRVTQKKYFEFDNTTNYCNKYRKDMKKTNIYQINVN